MVDQSEHTLQLRIPGSIFLGPGIVGGGWRAMVAHAVAQISKENIEQVLNATDIVDLVNSYVPLKRAGSQFRANCPFHNEKTPSFYVNPARQSFHCFGCGKGGDAISFVRDYENLPFVEAIRKLAQRSGVPIREEEESPEEHRRRRSKGRLLDLHREAAEFFHQQLLDSPDAAHARDYLKSRGFGREMAANWQVGWMPENARVFLDWARERKFSGRELVDAGICYLRDDDNAKSGIRVRFRDRLMFPIRNEIGDVIAFSGRQLREDPNSGKYINSPETILFRKSRVLFALDRARKPILREKAALLCEGQLDVIACHEQGIDHALAPLGTAFTNDHAKLLKRYAKQVVICYDADAAGLAATTRTFRELVPEGLAVSVARMPAGEDPDSYLSKHGPEGFRELLDGARDFYDFKLEMARDQGLLDTASGRAAALAECAELLGLMGDFAERENQINVVAGRLQTSGTALRGEIARLKSRPQWRQRGEEPRDENESAPVEPTHMHRIVAFMCHLALSSTASQHLLAEQYETLHEASPWLEGIPLLESILTAAPDPDSHSAVNAFLAGLPESDRLALTRGAVLEGAPDDGMMAAEHALALLSGTVLQRRDASVKAALKQPGLTPERMAELIAETKEISTLLRGIGQRFEFDDELPPSTFKPKIPEWRRRFEKRQTNR